MEAWQVDVIRDELRKQTADARAMHAEGLRDRPTLRDYFAAAAIGALLSDHEVGQKICDDPRYPETPFRDLVAENAYDFADAMIKARGRP